MFVLSVGSDLTEMPLGMVGLVGPRQAVLASPFLGGIRGLRMGPSHQKNFVGYMYKYAVFDIKKYNHYIFIIVVQLQSSKISFVGRGGQWEQTSDWGACPLPP